MMRMVFFRLIFAAAIAASLFVCAAGQSLPTAKTFVGEKLVYEAKFSKIISMGSIADLSFSFEQKSEGDNYFVKTTAVSKGTLIKLFRFSFLQDYETTIDPLSFNVVSTKKHDVQRDRIRDSVADFDYKAKRVTFVESDPNNPTKPPRRIASSLELIMNDLVSGIYRIRMMPLSVGKSFDIDVSDSGLVYTVPVRVTARELQRSVFGKVWCYRITPIVFGPGRLIEQKGSMDIWLVDDERRTPVRSALKTEYGKIDIRLKDYNFVSPFPH